jgi:hypothetical protein
VVAAWGGFPGCGRPHHKEGLRQANPYASKAHANSAKQAGERCDTEARS